MYLKEKNPQHISEVNTIQRLEHTNITVEKISLTSLSLHTEDRGSNPPHQSKTVKVIGIWKHIMWEDQEDCIMERCAM